MAENTGTQKTPKPNPNLENFDKFIGTWRWSGGLQGSSTYEWAEGGFFLIHRYDFEQDGRKIKGIEIAGHEHGLNSEPSKEIKSRLYNFMDGMTLEYIHEIEGDTLTTWFDEKGSDSVMRGKFSDDGKKLEIEWKYPGGGYKATAVKIE